MLVIVTCGAMHCGEKATHVMRVATIWRGPLVGLAVPHALFRAFCSLSLRRRARTALLVRRMPKESPLFVENAELSTFQLRTLRSGILSCLLSRFSQHVPVRRIVRLCGDCCRKCAANAQREQRGSKFWTAMLAAQNPQLAMFCSSSCAAIAVLCIAVRRRNIAFVRRGRNARHALRTQFAAFRFCSFRFRPVPVSLYSRASAQLHRYH